ncbi:DUF2807 domain-containing protein [Flavobacterium piscinae]|uniref:DUF2807 domain-containing protein n=1 Tax=Flavobacterium piscinae TaxID=2506424 RepID=A0A4Q1KF99_9FLAO|nr:head GIN domain-containing protein [Flavobacterium piscinae]RXR28331.1 DUF2807 domain-containing protein [Flavobacterium piscinae]
MKKIITLVTVLAVSIVSAQWGQEKIKGNGNIISKNITTSDYDEIGVAGAFHVTLVEGKEGKITLKGEENLLEYVIIETDGSNLKIKTEKGISLYPSKGKKIEIIVPVEDISAASLAGSGDIIADFTIKTTQFKVALAGSGDITLRLDSDTIEASLSGSGNIKLGGKTANLEASVAGSGDIEAFELTTQNSKLNVSGSGNISTNCTEYIEARVAGSGDIEYKGKPKKVDTKVAGSGKIKMM